MGKVKGMEEFFFFSFFFLLEPRRSNLSDSSKQQVVVLVYSRCVYSWIRVLQRPVIHRCYVHKRNRQTEGSNKGSSIMFQAERNEFSKTFPQWDQ